MTPQLNDEERSEEDLLLEKIRPYHYIEQTFTRRVQHYYLSQLVEEAHKYADMIHQIQTATSDSVVWIHLNTPGGILDTGIQIINAMQVSEAHVIASLEGEVASLGTMIFLAADEFIVHDNCLMMFHNYTGAVVGKGHEQIAALKAATTMVEGIMERLYVPFMSADEFDKIKKGEDLYFHADEIRERLKVMVEAIEREKEDKEVAEDEAAKDEILKLAKQITAEREKKKKSRKKKVVSKKASTKSKT